ncbi:MAG TPA: iron-sulfur cluster assembly protein [Prolixibacteraceae bacterium]|nr:iron-sulfur cluster assembly protein [Prolixibacteraceae bacterium]HQN93323.1 iron-sulfur cluster assembly protein [Prolixibacteraceae bacterium]
MTSNNDQRITDIIEMLREVYDPEIPVNIYDLGLVYSIDVDESNMAHIVMTLTAPGCPVADMIVQNVYENVCSVEGVDDAFVDLTFDPPWDKSMMSEEARLELGFF